MTHPRLLGEKDAARHLGISPTTLRGLGIRRRILGARRLYDCVDLDAYADSLPYENGEGGEHGRVNTCDAVLNGASA